MRGRNTPSFPALVQEFFTEYLVAQRAEPANGGQLPHSMTLFLGYATQQLGKQPVAVQLTDITPWDETAAAVFHQRGQVVFRN